MLFVRKYLISLIIIWICFSTQSQAQEENFIALSIYNFTRYIDWPVDESSKDFVIDVIGHKSVYDKLKEIVTGRRVGNKSIVVRFIESTNNITKSQILFVGFWQSKEISKVVEKVGSEHTLIITEKDGLLDSGSGINYIIRNDVIKFEIKKANINKYGLTVGETLLNLAYKSY